MFVHTTRLRWRHLACHTMQVPVETGSLPTGCKVSLGYAFKPVGAMLQFAWRVWISLGSCVDSHLSGLAALRGSEKQGQGVTTSNPFYSQGSLSSTTMDTLSIAHRNY